MGLTILAKRIVMSSKVNVRWFSSASSNQSTTNTIIASNAKQTIESELNKNHGQLINNESKKRHIAAHRRVREMTDGTDWATLSPNVQPIWNYLSKELNFSKAQFEKILKSHPNFVYHQMETLMPKFQWLNANGISDKHLRTCLLSHPQTMGLSISTFEEKKQWLAVEFPELTIATAAEWIFTCNCETLSSKASALVREFDISRKVLVSMARMGILALNQQRVFYKMRFLESQLDAKATSLLAINPMVLKYSMEKRLMPRLAFCLSTSVRNRLIVISTIHRTDSHYCNQIKRPERAYKEFVSEIWNNETFIERYNRFPNAPLPPPGYFDPK